MLLRSAFGVLGVLGVAVLAAGAQACSDDDPASPNNSSSSSSSSSSGSSGVIVDAGDTAPKPIESPAGEWTWVPFEDSTCGNGTSTGIVVNKGTSKRVVIYMEGGGACWNEGTCGIGQLATYLNGFSEDTFKSEIVPKMTGSHLDRTTVGNPYKDASFVYIPYCTGDVHSGDKEGTYGSKVVKHYGRRNIAAYLKRIVPTFKDAERVTLTGSSAGGFGAALNYHRFATAFGTTRVDLVDDSGPPFPAEKMIHYASAWTPAWDLAGAFPEDCTGCAAEPTKLLPYYLTKYANARFTLLSTETDQTIRNFYEFPATMPGSVFKTTLEATAAATFDTSQNGRYFIIQGSLHTMLGRMDKPDADPVKGTGDVTLAAFLTAMDTDATWTTVKLPAL